MVVQPKKKSWWKKNKSKSNVVKLKKEIYQEQQKKEKDKIKQEIKIMSRMQALKSDTENDSQINMQHDLDDSIKTTESLSDKFKKKKEEFSAWQLRRKAESEIKKEEKKRLKEEKKLKKEKEKREKEGIKAGKVLDQMHQQKFNNEDSDDDVII